MLLAAAFGLATRTPVVSDWPIIGTYGGDGAWTMAACGGLRAVLPGRSSVVIAAAGLAASFMVEASQTVSIEWLDHFRETRIGALLVGRGFLWSDLAAYSVGAAISWILDRIVLSRIRS